jgi:DNA-binding CsgD family transcriptional regulator/catechol 2,3-dioxygenase-like lactoylglutathione lyase family enzyme
MSNRGRPPHSDVLTPAEWRVVEGVRHGMSNPTIARRQRISVDAVKFHVSNALTKLGFSTRRELRQWPGVRMESALNSRETAMAGTEIGGLGQVARSVSDIAAAQRWYGEVLGLRHLYTFGKLAFFDMGGVRLYLDEGGSHKADAVLYFRVGDIHAAQAALAARGAVFTSAPHMIHRHDDGLEEWMAFFEDNEGRPLAIMAQVEG